MIFRFAVLALKRKKSPEQYYVFQNYQAKMISKELKKKGFEISDKNFLELGCGIGGYSEEFFKRVKNFTAADITTPDELLKRNKKIRFLKFDFNKKFPIKSKTYDIVFSASVIEHIKNRENFLKEINRILKDKGKLILTFPPFYSPVGGHIFKPFHYFGERAASKLTYFFKGHRAVSYAKAYGNWGLFPLTIRDVEKLLEKNGFAIKKEWVRYSPINFAKIPLIRDFLSWQVHFLCEKKK